MKKGTCFFTSMLVFFILIACCSAYGQNQLSAEKARDIENVIEKAMKEWKVPGVALAVVKDGKIIYSHGFGCRDLEKKLPVTPETVFPIGSCTKAFTAFTAGLMVDEGKLKWDEPVISYLPDFRMYDPVATKLTTTRDMLSHVTGLPTGAGEMTVYIRDMTRQDVYERLKFFPPDRTFRQSFEYCNLPFMLTGYLVGRLTSKTWDQVVRERIFTPLGMNSSSISVKELLKVENRSIGYLSRNKRIMETEYDSLTSIAPAGSINSNVLDMSKWLILQMNDGKLQGKELISHETLHEIHSPQVVVKNMEANMEKCDYLSDMRYALGWVVSDYRSRKLVWHTGSIAGFKSAVGFLPKEKIGVVVLTNLENSNMHQAAAFLALDRVIGVKPYDWNKYFLNLEARKMAKSEESDREMEKRTNPSGKGTKPSHPLNQYAGCYTNPVYGDITVVLSGDVLEVEFSKYRLTLDHLYFDTFMAKKKEPAKIIDPLNENLVQFKTDCLGNINTLLLPRDISSGLEFTKTE